MWIESTLSHTQVLTRLWTRLVGGDHRCRHHCIPRSGLCPRDSSGSRVLHKDDWGRRDYFLFVQCTTRSTAAATTDEIHRRTDQHPHHQQHHYHHRCGDTVGQTRGMRRGGWTGHGTAGNGAAVEDTEDVGQMIELDAAPSGHRIPPRRRFKARRTTNGCRSEGTRTTAIVPTRDIVEGHICVGRRIRSAVSPRRPQCRVQIPQRGLPPRMIQMCIQQGNHGRKDGRGTRGTEDRGNHASYDHLVFDTDQRHIRESASIRVVTG